MVAPDADVEHAVFVLGETHREPVEAHGALVDSQNFCCFVDMVILGVVAVY